MKTPWLRDQSPTVQTFAFMLLMFLSAIVVGNLAQFIIRILFDIDVMNEPEIMNRFDQPGVLSANRLLTLLNQLGVFLLPAMLMKRMISPPEEDYLLIRQKVSWLPVILVAAMAILAQAPTNFIYNLNQHINFPESMQGIESNIVAMEEERQQVISALFDGGNDTAFLLNLLLLAVIPAIAEEFFFRGILQNLFLRSFRGHQQMAIWMTAFIFSFIHFEFLGFFPRLLLGALLGYVYFKSGNLWYAVILHFINNALGIVMHYLTLKNISPESAEMFGANENEKIPLVLSTLILAGLIYYFGKKSGSRSYR